MGPRGLLRGAGRLCRTGGLSAPPMDGTRLRRTGGPSRAGCVCGGSGVSGASRLRRSARLWCPGRLRGTARLLCPGRLRRSSGLRRSGRLCGASRQGRFGRLCGTAYRGMRLRRRCGLRRCAAGRRSGLPPGDIRPGGRGLLLRRRTRSGRHIFFITLGLCHGRCSFHFRPGPSSRVEGIVCIYLI